MFYLCAHTHTHPRYLLTDHLEKPLWTEKEVKRLTTILTCRLRTVGTSITPIVCYASFNLFLEAEIPDFCVFSREKPPVSALTFQPAIRTQSQPDRSHEAVRVSAPGGEGSNNVITAVPACQPWSSPPIPSEGSSGEAREH